MKVSRAAPVEREVRIFLPRLSIAAMGGDPGADPWVSVQPGD